MGRFTELNGPVVNLSDLCRHFLTEKAYLVRRESVIADHPDHSFCIR